MLWQTPETLSSEGAGPSDVEEDPHDRDAPSEKGPSVRNDGGSLPGSLLFVNAFDMGDFYLTLCQLRNS